jgi:hypothetical protein
MKSRQTAPAISSNLGGLRLVIFAFSGMFPPEIHFQLSNH